MATLEQKLEAQLERMISKYGSDAAGTRQVRRQLEAIQSGLPQNAQAMFLMGGSTHSGNSTFRRRKTAARPRGEKGN